MQDAQLTFQQILLALAWTSPDSLDSLHPFSLFSHTDSHLETISTSPFTRQLGEGDDLEVPTAVGENLARRFC